MAVVGLCVLCLPLTGSTGLALALPVIVLLAVAAWLHRHSDEHGIRATRWLAIVATAAALLVVAAYNVFETRPVTPNLTFTLSPQQIFTIIGQFAAVGYAAPPVSPQLATSSSPLAAVGAYFAPEWVDRTWRMRALVTVMTWATALALCIGPAVRRGRITFGHLGPAICLFSVACLAFAIGYARGSGLDQRYVVLGATGLVTIYVCLRLHRSRVAAVTGGLLAIVAVVLLPWNAYYALSFGEARLAFQANLVRDIRAGTPVDVLGTRYYPDIWGDPVLAAGAIREMRDDRIGPFANGDLQLNDAPPAVATTRTISVEPIAAHNISQVGDYWQGVGNDSYLLYSVKQADLAGIRLTYSLANPSARPAYLQLTWSTTPDGSFDARGNTFVVWGAPTDNQPRQTTAWIGNTVDMLKVIPDNEPSSFKLDSLELLLSK
ncbi:MAG: hypothetical protein JOZ87_12565 [Chloroflexi bacterium]|nr:hypothetical protein [Chloroflexota bacterium]